jgi:hypothetical protein
MPEEKAPADVLRWPNSEPVVVLRPVEPKMTVMYAEIAVKHQSDEAMREAIESRPFTFVGFLVERDGQHMIVDHAGENPMALEAGDVLAEPSQLHAAD